MHVFANFRYGYIYFTNAAELHKDGHTQLHLALPESPEKFRLWSHDAFQCTRHTSPNSFLVKSWLFDVKRH